MFVDNLKSSCGPVVGSKTTAAISAVGVAWLFSDYTSGDAQPAADTAPDMDKEEF